MKMLMASLMLAVTPLGSSAAAEGYACNMQAMSKSERATYGQLTRSVRGSLEDRRELEDGYAFRLPANTLVDAARWVALESKCCPFFAFELKVGRDGGPLWLHVTGGEGIKEFIRAEFQLD